MLVETAQERNESIFPALIYSCEWTSRMDQSRPTGPAGPQSDPGTHSVQTQGLGVGTVPRNSRNSSAVVVVVEEVQYQQRPDGGAAGKPPGF